MATHAGYSLQLIVESFSIGSKQVAQSSFATTLSGLLMHWPLREQFLLYISLKMLSLTQTI
jgi:hypothetical protein